MVELTNILILIASVLLILCIFASILSRKFGAPLLLAFLVLGMLAGEDGPGGIAFDSFDMAFLLGNIALAVIIFDGGLGTQKSSFRVSLAPALSLSTLGVFITSATTGVAAWYVFDLSYAESFLIGAIVGSTDAAAVFGLLKTAKLRLKERTSSTLEMESGTNDPMAIFLTIALVEIMSSDVGSAGLAFVFKFFQQMGLGIALGFLGGYCLKAFSTKMAVPSSLYPLFAFSGALCIFGLTNLWGGSGFLAIYIAGAILGNSKTPYLDDIQKFHDGMAWLSQIGMFVMLGLLVTPSRLVDIAMPALILSAVLVFVARPLAVVISLAPFHFPWREKIFISWCGLRGAVPIILALFPLLAGIEHSIMYFEVAFFVVFMSLLVQGWTIAPLARWLNIEIPPSDETQHVTLQLPSIQQTLFIFRAMADCLAVGRIVPLLNEQCQCRIVGLIRNETLITSLTDERVQEHDQLIFIGSDDNISEMSRLFSGHRDESLKIESLFYGIFEISPDSAMQDLQSVYGIDVSEKELPLTVAEFLNSKFHQKPVVGDKFRFETITVIVKTMHEGTITGVGVKINEA